MSRSMSSWMIRMSDAGIPRSLAMLVREIGREKKVSICLCLRNIAAKEVTWRRIGDEMYLL